MHERAGEEGTGPPVPDRVSETRSRREPRPPGRWASGVNGLPEGPRGVLVTAQEAGIFRLELDLARLPCRAEG